MPWQVSKYISSLLTRLKRSNLLPGLLGPNPRQDDLVLEQYNRISLPLGLSVSKYGGKSSQEISLFHLRKEICCEGQNRDQIREGGVLTSEKESQLVCN